MAVIFIGPVQAIGAANGLEQVVVAQSVVEVNVGTAGRIEARQQLTRHDQQLHIRRFFDEPPLHFVLVLFGGLAFLQNELRVGVELVALVAVGRFP